MKKLSKYLIAILMSLSAPAFATIVVVGPGTVTYLENGWFGEGYALHLSVGVAGCPAPITEFGLLPSHPQYKEILVALLMAYSSGENVTLVADAGECVLGNRTKIVSVRMSH